MADKIKLYELVELTVPAGATQGRFNFNTQPQLRNQGNQTVYINDIQVFTLSSYANSQVTPALTGLAIADVSKAVLTLYVNGEEGIKFIPLAQLVHVNDNAGVYQQYIEGFDTLQNVDWDKSYVQFSVAPATQTAFVIPFGIKYTRLFLKTNPQNLLQSQQQ